LWREVSCDHPMDVAGWWKRCQAPGQRSLLSLRSGWISGNQFDCHSGGFQFVSRLTPAIDPSVTGWGTVSIRPQPCPSRSFQFIAIMFTYSAAKLYWVGSSDMKAKFAIRLCRRMSRYSDWLRTREVGVRVPVEPTIVWSPCCPDRLWGPVPGG
jgi:hypothetical protein